MKHTKKIAILLAAILSMTSFAACGNNTPDEVSVVMDCTKYNGMSTESLKSELGEPKRIEDWENETSKGAFQMQIYSYDLDETYSEFIIYDNAVVKLRLFSNSQWQIEGSKFDNIFAMFGITPDKSARKIVDNGITYKFSPVSDDVEEIDFYNYDKNDRTFDTVYVTYDLAYFD